MHQSGITCAIYFCTFSHIIAIEQLYKAKRVAEAMMKMLSRGDISVIRSKVCSAVISTNRSTNLWKIHLLLGFYKISNTNLKLGIVIIQVNCIVQESFVSIATCIEKIKFSALIMQRVYSHYR